MRSDRSLNHSSHLLKSQRQSSKHQKSRKLRNPPWAVTTYLTSPHRSNRLQRQPLRNLSLCPLSSRPRSQQPQALLPELPCLTSHPRTNRQPACPYSNQSRLQPNKLHQPQLLLQSRRLLRPLQLKSFRPINRRLFSRLRPPHLTRTLRQRQIFRLKHLLRVQIFKVSSRNRPLSRHCSKNPHKKLLIWPAHNWSTRLWTPWSYK